MSRPSPQVMLFLPLDLLFHSRSPMQVRLAYRCALVLRDLIHPYLLRRLKKDLEDIIHLPSKTEQVLVECHGMLFFYCCSPFSRQSIHRLRGCGVSSPPHISQVHTMCINEVTESSTLPQRRLLKRAFPLLSKSSLHSPNCSHLPQVLFCRLTSYQRHLYSDFLDSTEVKSVLSRTMRAFRAISILRKLCNHPDLACRVGDSVATRCGCKEAQT